MTTIVSYKQFMESFPQEYKSITENIDEKSALGAACLGTFETLMQLWNHEDPYWNTIKNRVQLSFSKGSKKTNTSVTSGTASLLLQNEGEEITFLNCGTGSVKVQVYKMGINGVIEVIEDLKPETLSFSDLNINGIYSPNEKTGITSEALIENLKTTLDLSKAKGPIYALITGTIRKTKFDALPINQWKMENEVRKIFENLNIEIIPWNGISYFISQKEEGFCEFYSIENMLKDMDKNLQPIVSIGIGKGSVQFSTKKKIIEYFHGMNEPHKLIGKDGMANTILKSFKGSYVKGCKYYKKPTIALKSGCLIYLLKEKKLFNRVIKCGLKYNELSTSLI
jgi:hypothetical protein